MWLAIPMETTCYYSGKRQYTRDQAIDALNTLVTRKRNGTIRDMCYAKRAYRCPDCGHYHLTKQEARRTNSADVFATI